MPLTHTRNTQKHPQKLLPRCQEGAPGRRYAAGERTDTPSRRPAGGPPPEGPTCSTPAPPPAHSVCRRLKHSFLLVPRRPNLIHPSRYRWWFLCFEILLPGSSCRSVLQLRRSPLPNGPRLSCASLPCVRFCQFDSHQCCAVVAGPLVHQFFKGPLRGAAEAHLQGRHGAQPPRLPARVKRRCRQ